MLARTRVFFKFRLVSIVFIVLTVPLLFTDKAFAQSDTTPPSTDFSINPESPDGLNGWYINSPNITLDATDLESGVKDIYWRVNSGSWKNETFYNTLNLAPNPSFEDSGDPVALWDVGEIGASYLQDDLEKKFGYYSAKISSTVSGWFSIRNETNFSPTTYLDNMSSSVWVKGSNVTSSYFKVYVLYTEEGVTKTMQIAESDKLSGTFDWVLIPLAFTVSVENAFGVYIDIGIADAGTIWIDGVTISSSVNSTTTTFTVSDQGEDVIEFYSVDNAGNEELPHNTESFKVDTRSPGDYRNFIKVQAGNNHTFVISIDVEDESSGMDVSTAEFQYYIEDKEATWGYYENFSDCSLAWNENEWLPADVSPNTDGAGIVTLQTPAIDFCNSNWRELKKIRFRITDLAGNTGISPDMVINGPWVKVNKGDVYADSGIGMGSNSEAEYLIRSGASINNFTSLSSWYVSFSKEKSRKEDYNWWVTNFPPQSPLPDGKIPASSGRYEVDSSFILDSTSLNNFDSVNDTVVYIFVNGDMVINVDYSLPNSSALFFIVNGNVVVSDSVENIEGFFILDGEFKTSDVDVTYSSGKGLEVTGGIIADSFNFIRSLTGNSNEDYPAEIINYDPKYLVLGSGMLGVLGSMTWREVSYRTPETEPVGETCTEAGGVCCSEDQTGIGEEYPDVTDCAGNCFDSCDNYPSSSIGVWLKWNNFVIFWMSASDDEDPDYNLSCLLEYGDGESSVLDCRFGFWAHIYPCSPNEQCAYTASWSVTDTQGGTAKSSTGVIIDSYFWRF